VCVQREAEVTEQLLGRVKREFLEMPGLRLTPSQAQRLWHLDEGCCGALLQSLVDAQFLFRTREGAFMRIDRARGARTRPLTPAAVVA
jgi:hypothetical protein